VKKKKKGTRKEKGKEKDQSQITIASHDAVASVHFKIRDDDVAHPPLHQPSPSIESFNAQQHQAAQRRTPR
jgi:hypothetical protein